MNDGDDEVVAMIEVIPAEGGTAAAPATITVPAHGTAAVPPELWEAARTPRSSCAPREGGWSPHGLRRRSSRTRSRSASACRSHEP